jgi:hypothetical protein
VRTKYKVPSYGNLNKALVIQGGAQIGVDLLLPDGSVPSLQELAAALAPYLSSSSSTETTSNNSVVFWSQVQSIPDNVLEVAALATVGLVTRKTGGAWITSAIQGTATRIVVTHGDGDAGDPTIDLATVVQDGNGTLYAVELDGYGRVTGHRAAYLVDLADVNYPTGTPAAGDVLTWDSGTGWTPQPPTGGGGSSYPAPQLVITGVF